MCFRCRRQLSYVGLDSYDWPQGKAVCRSREEYFHRSDFRLGLVRNLRYRPQQDYSTHRDGGRAAESACWVTFASCACSARARMWSTSPYLLQSTSHLAMREYWCNFASHGHTAGGYRQHGCRRRIQESEYCRACVRYTKCAGGGFGRCSVPVSSIICSRVVQHVLRNGFRLHRIALEVLQEPWAAYTNPVDPKAGFVGGGSYLSCLGDHVGIRKAQGPRVQLSRERKSSSLSSTAPDNGLVLNTSDWMSASPDGTSSRVRSQSIALGENRVETLANETNDGGRVKKGRRATASTTKPISRPLPTSGRARGLSTVSHQPTDCGAQTVQDDNVWQQDAGEAGIWTIVSTGKQIFCFMHDITLLTAFITCRNFPLNLLHSTGAI